MQPVKYAAIAVVFAAACAGRSAGSPPGPSPAPPSASAPVASATPNATATSNAVAVAVAPVEPAPAKPRLPAPRAFTLVRAGRVTSLALGKPPKVGVMIDGVVLVHDGKAFRELPALPPGVNFRDVELFFGRDDQPRLMGYSPRSVARAADIAKDAAPRALYLRFKGGRWQPEPSELGPLGSPEGALYGVLGFEDPEVVCRPRGVCLVKRLSGWKSVPAHPTPLPILLSGKTAWALGVDHVERLDASGFVELTPRKVFTTPSSVWVDAASNVWVAEPASQNVHRLSAGTWQTFPASVGAPHVLLGEPSGQLWVAGDAGVAFWHEDGFVPVAAVSGPLGVAIASSSELWFGGDAGLYRAQAL